MTSTKQVLRKIYSNLFLSSNQAEPVHTYRQNDLFLAEFPKSGVTWLTTLLSHLEIQSLKPLSNSREQTSASFKSLGFGALCKYVSDDSLPGRLSSYESTILGGRLIKTHSQCSNIHQRVIYLYRHPASVMHSYWLMLKGYRAISQDLSLEEFCLDAQHGLLAWKQHVNSYIYCSEPGAQICFISYEDLLLDTVRSLQKIINIFSDSLLDVSLSKAVELSSRIAMQESESILIESDYRYKVRFDPGYRFVGSHERGKKLIESIKPLVLDFCADELSLLYQKSA